MAVRRLCAWRLAWVDAALVVVDSRANATTCFQLSGGLFLIQFGVWGQCVVFSVRKSNIRAATASTECCFSCTGTFS